MHLGVSAVESVKRINAGGWVKCMVDLVQFAIEIVGVFIGAFAAFEFDSFRERQSENKESVRVLKLFKHELEVNLRQMFPEIRKGLRETRMPFSPLELEIWDAISNKIDRISNDHTLQAIAKAYYQLHMLERVTEGYRTLTIAYSFTADTKVSSNVQSRLKRSEGIIMDQLREPKDAQDRTIIQTVNEAVTEIDKEIQRLEGGMM